MIKRKITPRGQYVLVKPDKEQSKENEYGLIIPDSIEQEPKVYGEVIDCGPKVEGLKKGQTVIFGKYAGEDIKFRDTKAKIEYKLLNDEDILAILE